MPLRKANVQAKIITDTILRHISGLGKYSCITQRVHACTPIGYTLALKCFLYEYFGANVSDVVVLGLSKLGTFDRDTFNSGGPYSWRPKKAREELFWPIRAC